jgi:hypothetical protein
LSRPKPTRVVKLTEEKEEEEEEEEEEEWNVESTARILTVILVIKPHVRA